MTSPTDYTPQPQVDQLQSPLSGLIREFNSLSDSMLTGHVTDDGYDPAERYGRYPSHLVPETEMGEKNWNENEKNMAGVGGWLGRRDDRDFGSTFPGDQEALHGQPIMEDRPIPHATPPPPSPLPAPVLAPSPSTNVGVAGGGLKTLPVKVLGEGCTGRR